MAEQGVSVANLIATLKLDISQFQTAVQQLDQNLAKIQTGTGAAGSATDALQEAASKAGSALGAMGGASGLLSGALTLLLNPLTLAVAAFAGLEQVMTQAKEAAKEHAREMETLMAVSGLSATQASDLSDTFKALGFSGDAVTLAMFRLGTEIETGGGHLGRLGVALRDTTGGLKTEGQLFLEVRDRISELGTASERNALLMEVFGRAGRSLAPIFALSREEFDRWMQRAELLAPWSNEAQAATMELIRAQAALDLAWKGLWESLGAALAGPAAGFLTWLADVVIATKQAVQWAHNHAEALAEVPLIGLAGPGPTPSGVGAGDQTQPSLGLPSLADFQASKVVLAGIFQEQQQYFAKLQALRHADVAADKIDQSVALQSTVAYLNARAAATTAHFATLRQLTIAQYGTENAAAITHLQEVKTLESAAQAAIVQARIAAGAQLAALTVAQQKQQLEQSIAGDVAMATEEERLTELRLKDEERFLDTLKPMWEEMRQTGIKAWVDIAEAQITAEEEGTKAWRTQFGELTKDLEAFQRQVAATTAVAGIERGAGVPGTNLTGQLQTLTQSRIATLVQESQPWRDAIKNVEEGSDAFNDLQGHIAEADRQLAVLTTDLQGLQQINALKGLVTDVFGSLERAISTSVTGVIQGTQTMQQAFAKMGQAIVISLEEMLIKRGFKALEDGFNTMLDSMDARAAISTALRFLSSAFGGSPAAGTPSSSGPPDLGGVEPTAFQSGGLVTQPTFGLIGEHGPEAVIPLDRLQVGGGGAPIQVIVNNNTSAEVTTQEGTGADGQRQLEIYVDNRVNKGIAGGTYDKMLQSIFGLSRQGVGR